MRSGGRVPTAADSSEGDVPARANGLDRCVERLFPFAVSRERLDGSLQFLRLAKNVLQKNVWSQDSPPPRSIVKKSTQLPLQERVSMRSFAFTFTARQNDCHGTPAITALEITNHHFAVQCS